MKRLIIVSIIITLFLATTTGTMVAANAQGNQALDHVVISPESATVPTSGTWQFTAAGQNALNQTVNGVSYTWEVVAGGGTINSTGLFKAGTTAGTFTDTILVTAVKGDVTKTTNATVTVAIPGILEHVAISPDTLISPVSGTQQFTATAEDAFNQTVSDVTYTWEVVAGGGTIDDTGLFTAGTTAGTFTDTILVTATKDDITKTTPATVIVNVPNENGARIPPGWSHGKKTGWHGAETPPGWSKGEKTGWNGENMPPGKMAKNK